MTDPAPRPGGTKERILEAALATLREEGFSETTARAIARRGGFNQALIFYHFGSVTNVLLEAFRGLSEEQVAKYRAAASEVSSLSDLVEIARRLHDEDLETGAVTAVIQLMASASTREERGEILNRFEAWIAIVEEALERGTRGYGLQAVIPTRQAAYAISAMFLGIELISRLDPQRSETEPVFDMMAGVASLIENVAPTLLPLVAEQLQPPTKESEAPER